MAIIGKWLMNLIDASITIEEEKEHGLPVELP
jgi:hypothetical protein